MKKLLIAIVSLFILSLLAGCGDGGTQTVDPSKTGSAAPEVKQDTQSSDRNMSGPSQVSADAG